MAESNNNTYVSKASLKNIGIPSSKMKLSADLIRGKKVLQVIGILKNTRRRANPYLLDLVNSAVANSVNKGTTIKTDDLRIKTIIVMQGRSLKRTLPRAMGRGNIILKRSCHVYIELA